MGYTPDEDNTIMTVNVIFSTFSGIGSMFIISNFLIFPKLRKFAFKLVVMISVADVVTAIGNFLGSPNADTAACYLQSIISNTGYIGSFFWVGAMAWTINRLILSTQESFDAKDQQILYKYLNMCIWPGSFFLAALPISTDSIGPAGGWCWLNNETTADKMWRMIGFYIPLWLVIGYVSWVYYRVWKVVRNYDDRPAMLKRMMFYPAILIICWTPATIRRLLELASGKDAPFWLACVQIAFNSSLGMWNAIVYGLTPDVRAQNKKSCASLCNTKGDSHYEFNNESSDDEADDEFPVDEKNVDMSPSQKPFVGLRMDSPGDSMEEPKVSSPTPLVNNPNRDADD